MAVIKAVNKDLGSKAKVKKIIDYATKDEKTNEDLVSCKDCMVNSVLDEMAATKQLYNKTGGRQYLHYVHSFSPKDPITPEQAHAISKELVENNADLKGYEVLVATHIDKTHIHTHIIVNSVSFENGTKFQSTPKFLNDLKSENDCICEREGLSVVKEPSKDITCFNLKKYRAIEKGIQGKEKSYVLQTGLDVSNSLNKCTSRKEFIKDMEKNGYKVNWSDTRKYVTFQTPTGEKVRNSNLERTFKQEKFTKGGMEHELQCNRERAQDTARARRGANVDWSAVERNIQSQENRVPEQSVRIPEQSGTEIIGTIQQQVRDVEERTERVLRNSREKDRRAADEQRPRKERNRTKDFGHNR